MGGNAFENLKRLSASDYKLFEAQMLAQVRQLYPHVAALRYYRQKPDFGDLDLVVCKPMLEQAQFAVFLEQIGADEVIYHKEMTSFRYQDFQVDLIYVDPLYFESAQFYFADNDLNNLIGRIAHKLGLKFGWDGLSYTIRTEAGHRAQKIQLSTDPAEIYAFLGYDYTRWQAGFDDLEAIFEFVTGSRYFNPEIFAYEQLNSSNRSRNRKRTTYTRFLEWLQAPEQVQRLANQSYHFYADKSLYLVKLHNAFPAADLLGQVKHYAEAQAAHEARKIKFNSKLISQWNGLTGKALGQATQQFKQDICLNSDFEAYLDSQSAEQIKADFLAWNRQQSLKSPELQSQSGPG